MADDGYTTIHRTTDAAQGEMMAEMLRREGIAARFHKVSSNLIGMSPLLIEMTVDVPVESEARARELLGDLEYTAAADALEAGPEEEAAPTARSRWRALARSGFTLFLPGTCHLYAGRPWTALVLAAAAAGCVGIMVSVERESLAFGAALAALIVIMPCDMIAGVRAAAAENLGRHAERGRQVVTGLLLAAVAATIGVATRTAIEAPGWWRARQLRRFSLTCTRTSIVIENRDGADRYANFHRVGIATPSPAGGDGIQDVRLAGGAKFRLRAETTGRLPFTAPLDVLAACAAGRSCFIVVDVTLESAEDHGPLPLHAIGECTPGWGAQSDEVQGRLTLSEADGE
jgi:uncharacterized membrane protein YjjB (DUF3815 family)